LATGKVVNLKQRGRRNARAEAGNHTSYFIGFSVRVRTRASSRHWPKGNGIPENMKSQGVNGCIS